MTRRPWTGAEIKRATAMARHADVHRIAVALGRTPKAVQSMFERHGIKVTALRAWTPEEDAFLHANGTLLTTAAIGKHLKRSADAVRRRAALIGADLQKRGLYHHCATHSPETVALYNLLRAQGATHHAAARLAGVHPSTALRWDKARIASLKTDDMHE